jgi:hypothetical protein
MASPFVWSKTPRADPDGRAITRPTKRGVRLSRLWGVLLLVIAYTCAIYKQNPNRVGGIRI